jgi:hypothetical protein
VKNPAPIFDGIVNAQRELDARIQGSSVVMSASAMARLLDLIDILQDSDE